MVNRIYGGMGRGFGMVIESDRPRHTLDIRHFLYQHNEPPLYVQQFFFVRQKFRSASWLNLSKYFFEAHFLAIILNGLSVEVLGENHDCRNFNVFVK